MAREPRSLEDLESIVRLTELAHWPRLRAAVLDKLARHEESVSKVVFKTRTPVDPIEIEYARGFRQGVMYVLEGLPNQAKLELARRLAETERGDT